MKGALLGVPNVLIEKTRPWYYPEASFFWFSVVFMRGSTGY